MSYNRYSSFIKNGNYEIIPSIKIYHKDSDLTEIYEQGKSRLDLISYKYYGDANYDWLIMMANPEYGSLEFNIPDGAVLRIPYPLNITIENYNNAIEIYKQLYK